MSAPSLTITPTPEFVALVAAEVVKHIAEHASHVPSRTYADDPILVDTQAASELLGMSLVKVKHMALAGELPSIKIGTARRFRVDALRQWAAEQEARQMGATR